MGPERVPDANDNVRAVHLVDQLATGAGQHADVDPESHAQQLRGLIDGMKDSLLLPINQRIDRNVVAMSRGQDREEIGEVRDLSSSKRPGARAAGHCENHPGELRTRDQVSSRYRHRRGASGQYFMGDTRPDMHRGMRTPYDNTSCCRRLGEALQWGGNTRSTHLARSARDDTLNATGTLGCGAGRRQFALCSNLPTTDDGRRVGGHDVNARPEQTGQRNRQRECVSRAIGPVIADHILLSRPHENSPCCLWTLSAVDDDTDEAMTALRIAAALTYVLGLAAPCRHACPTVKQ